MNMRILLTVLLVATVSASETFWFEAQAPAAVAALEAGELIVGSELPQRFPAAILSERNGRRLIVARCELRKSGTFPVSLLAAGKSVPITAEHEFRKERYDLVALIDSSHSMRKHDPDNARLRALQEFLDLARQSRRIQHVGVVSFRDEPEVIQVPVAPQDCPDVASMVRALRPRGSTDFDLPLAAAARMLDGLETGNRRAILLFSDGRPHRAYREAHESLRETPVFTIGLSAEVDQSLMARIAKKTGGMHVQAPDADALPALFRDVFHRIDRRQVAARGFLAAETELWLDDSMRQPLLQVSGGAPRLNGAENLTTFQRGRNTLSPGPGEAPTYELIASTDITLRVVTLADGFCAWLRGDFDGTATIVATALSHDSTLPPLPTPVPGLMRFSPTQQARMQRFALSAKAALDDQPLVRTDLISLQGAVRPVVTGPAAASGGPRARSFRPARLAERAVAGDIAPAKLALDATAAGLEASMLAEPKVVTFAPLYAGVPQKADLEIQLYGGSAGDAATLSIQPPPHVTVRAEGDLAGTATSRLSLIAATEQTEAGPFEGTVSINFAGKSWQVPFHGEVRTPQLLLRLSAVTVAEGEHEVRVAGIAELRLDPEGAAAASLRSPAAGLEFETASLATTADWQTTPFVWRLERPLPSEQLATEIVAQADGLMPVRVPLSVEVSRQTRVAAPPLAEAKAADSGWNVLWWLAWLLIVLALLALLIHAVRGNERARFVLASVAVHALLLFVVLPKSSPREEPTEEIVTIMTVTAGKEIVEQEVSAEIATTESAAVAEPEAPQPVEREVVDESTPAEPEQAQQETDEQPEAIAPELAHEPVEPADQSTEAATAAPVHKALAEQQPTAAEARERAEEMMDESQSLEATPTPLATVAEPQVRVPELSRPAAQVAPAESTASVALRHAESSERAAPEGGKLAREATAHSAEQALGPERATANSAAVAEIAIGTVGRAHEQPQDVREAAAETGRRQATEGAVQALAGERASRQSASPGQEVAEFAPARSPIGASGTLRSAHAAREAVAVAAVASETAAPVAKHTAQAMGQALAGERASRQSASSGQGVAEFAPARSPVSAIATLRSAATTREAVDVAAVASQAEAPTARRNARAMGQALAGERASRQSASSGQGVAEFAPARAPIGVIGTLRSAATTREAVDVAAVASQAAAPTAKRTSQAMGQALAGERASRQSASPGQEVAEFAPARAPISGSGTLRSAHAEREAVAVAAVASDPAAPTAKRTAQAMGQALAGERASRQSASPGQEVAEFAPARAPISASGSLRSAATREAIDVAALASQAAAPTAKRTAEVTRPGPELVGRRRMIIDDAPVGAVTIPAASTALSAAAALVRPGGTAGADAQHAISSQWQRTLPVLEYGGDWDCDATAMLHLAHQFEQRLGSLLPYGSRAIRTDDQELTEAPFLFMSGHDPFAMSATEVTRLAEYLAQGGCLWINDSSALDSEAFDGAVREALAQVLPGKRLAKIPLTAPLFAAPYDLSTGFLGYRVPPGDKYRLDYLEGVQLDGRWRVVYTRNDYGDGLEIDPRTHPLMPSLTDLSPREMQEGSVQMGINIVTSFLAHGATETLGLRGRDLAQERQDHLKRAQEVATEELAVTEWALPEGWTDILPSELVEQRDGGVRFRFALEQTAGASEKIVMAAQTDTEVHPGQTWIVPLQAQMASGSRLAMAFQFGDEYLESEPLFVRPGRNELVFELRTLRLKSAVTAWQFTASIDGTRTAERLFLLFYPQDRSATITIEPLRLGQR